MITKEKITQSIRGYISAGQDELSSIQSCLSALCDEYSLKEFSDREQLLHAIFAYAREIFGSDYGFEQFDLIMGRAFPTSETLRNISEKEGRNLYQ